MKLVNIGMVKINDVEIGGTITVNQSMQKGFYNTTKKNQGFGENGSDSSVFDVIGATLDHDVVDSIQYAKSKINKRKGTF